VPPDVLGRTKTLREIEALLDRQAATDPIAPEGSSGRTAPSGTAAKSAATTADPGPLLELVRKVVSDLTGYPTETIDPDMDIEADLGIDSIKRVEILSAVEERMPNLPPIAPEVLGRLKTLAQIVDQFQKGPAAEPNPADERPPVQEPSQSAAPASQADPDGPPEPLDRYRLKAVKRRAASSHRGLTIPAGRKVFITEDGGGFAAAIADCLGERGINTVLVSHDILRHRSQLPAAGGLILVTGPQTTLDTDYLKALFELARSQAEPLMTSSAAGGALLATITRMDGSFGCDGEGIANPLQGALAGLAKTAALEWEGVRCRALDVSSNWTDVTAAAEAVAAELLETAATEPIEVGLDRDRRIVLEMETDALAETNPADVGLEDGDLVMVSGGARGIAAAAARALADRVRLKLLLLGRSPAPEVEPEWLNGLETEAEIKKAILAHEFSDDRIPPRRLEAAYQRIVANRQVNRTLAAIRAAGSEAFYHSVDVRDREAVSRIAAERQREFGPVRALIHAAGVLQDRLIVDKTPEQFETVFSTKVDGLLALLQAVESAQLKHLVLFSSVAGRSGNRGQADYAMANEALNKIARQLAVELPQVRVRAVNWGPWDGGMVQPALRREFERRGISLIPVNEGCKHLLGEMALKSSDVEIVVGAVQLSPSQTRPHLEVSTPPAVDPAEAELTLAFERDIDIETHPVLKSHVIAGRPVVPLALMAEWFGQSALHGNPGLILQGLEDMRVLKGIDIDGTAKRVRLLAGSPSRSGAHYEVPLEIRDANDRGLHCRARAILTDALDPSPDYQRPAALGGNGYKRSPDEVYEKILFHGPDLQGIRQIVHLSDHGMVAGVAAAPAPAAWMTSPLRKHWLSDPLVLDAAFQMASVWCYERIGAVSLPSYCAQYRQYRRSFPAAGVSAVLEVEEATPRRLKGQFTFVDEENRVVARIVGYEAVVDPSLNRAFKPDGDPGRIESSLNAGPILPHKRAATG
jgi:NAD(P)-dependent dehydrogenase (short-subunit alcohol dehydrogenase family)/acyl carrier protein